MHKGLASCNSDNSVQHWLFKIATTFHIPTYIFPEKALAPLEMVFRGVLTVVENNKLMWDINNMSKILGC